MATDCIMVFTFANGAGPARANLELLGQARVLADKLGALRGNRPPVAGLLCGHAVEEAAREFAGFADVVHYCDHPDLAVYNPATYADVVGSLAEKYRPEIMLFPAGCAGQELAATVAARLKTGLASHAVGLDIDEQGCLVQLVASYGDAVLGEILCPAHRPQMVTVTAGLFGPAAPLPVTGRLIREDVVPSGNSALTVTGVEEKASSCDRLEEAPLVLAGGCGLQDKATWRALEELGAHLQAPVGCTRPVLDEGWADDERRMIGISGTVVGPAVYLGVGISGAAHHTVGMNRSGYVIAVNSDPGAPLLKMADLAVVGDGAAIIEEMLKLVRERRNPEISG